MGKAVVYSFETRRPIQTVTRASEVFTKKTRKKYRVKSWTRFILGLSFLLLAPIALLAPIILFIRLLFNLLM